MRVKIHHELQRDGARPLEAGATSENGAVGITRQAYRNFVRVVRATGTR